MPYAIIENETVVNAIVADEAFAAQIGAILMPDGIRIGDLYIDGEFIRVVPEEPELEQMSMPEVGGSAALRAEIDELREQMAQLTALLTKEGSYAEH